MNNTHTGLLVFGANSLFPSIVGGEASDGGSLMGSFDGFGSFALHQLSSGDSEGEIVDDATTAMYRRALASAEATHGYS